MHELPCGYLLEAVRSNHASCSLKNTVKEATIKLLVFSLSAPEDP